MQNSEMFNEKKILIVGASSGIGRQTAISLNKLGADVILIARRENKLAEIIDELSHGNNAFYVLDLSDLNSIEPLFNRIFLEHGRIDGLVYAAGMSMSLPLNMLKPEKLNKLFAVNFFAFIECIRNATKRGRYNEGMRIVGVSSVASLVGDKTHIGYSASKAAMDAAVRCIAKEVAEKRIYINTIAPGMTKTEMYNSFIQKHGEDSQSYQDLLRRQYLGIANIEDIVSVIIFLLSPASSFITGITLPVDGGMSTT